MANTHRALGCVTNSYSSLTTLRGKETPAMAAGITKRPLRVGEILGWVVPAVERRRIELQAQFAQGGAGVRRGGRERVLMSGGPCTVPIGCRSGQPDALDSTEARLVAVIRVNGIFGLHMAPGWWGGIWRRLGTGPGYRTTANETSTFGHDGRQCPWVDCAVLGGHSAPGAG